MQDQDTVLGQADVQQWQPPSVDEVIPLWTPDPGRTGRAKAEKAAKAANAAARETYERMVEELMTARGSAGYWRVIAGQRAEEIAGLGKDITAAAATYGEMSGKLAASERMRREENAASQTFATVEAQLAHDTKLEARQVSIDLSTGQQGPRMFLMLGSNNDFSVVLTSRPDGKVEVAIEEGRVMSFIVGPEGLDDDQRNAIKGYFSKKRLPSTAKSEQASASTDKYADVLAFLTEQNCGSEFCPFHRKGGLADTLKSLGGILNVGSAALYDTLGEYGITKPRTRYHFDLRGFPYSEKARRESGWDWNH